MKKLIALILAFAAVSLHADIVKIGVILPLTGNNANLGQWQLDAIKLVQKELETTKTQHTYQVVLEDDQLVGRMTAEALNKLINLDHVAGLVTFTSGSGNVAAPRAQQAKIVHFGIASDSKVANGEWNFIHWTRPEAEVNQLVEFLKKKGYQRLAILAVRQQGIQAITTELKKQLQDTGIQVVEEANFNPGERDFRVMLGRIAEKKPDIFFPGAFSPELQIILRQRKQAGVDCAATTIEAFDFLDAGDKPLVAGAYSVSGSAPSGQYLKSMQAIGIKEPGPYSAFMYDSLHMIIDALEQCPSPNTDRTPALAFLNNVKDRNAAVGKISIDKDGIVHSPAGLYQIVGDKNVPVDLKDVK